MTIKPNLHTRYPDAHDRELAQAFLSLKTTKEIQSFLRDLLTIAEIKEASKRFQIAKLLWQGRKSYLQIAETHHTSTTTVTRVADWLKNQPYGGYRTILSRLYPKMK